MLLSTRLARLPVASKRHVRPEVSHLAPPVASISLTQARNYADETKKEVEKTESGSKRRPAHIRRRIPDRDRAMSLWEPDLLRRRLGDLDLLDTDFPLLRPGFGLGRMGSDFGLGRMGSDLDRFFRTPLDFVDMTTAEMGTDFGWVPLADIGETKENYELQVEVPGISKENLKIKVDDSTNTLTVAGERKSEKEEDTKGRYRREMSYGSFQRSWTLPDNAKLGDVKANYDNGVLKVTIPKTEPSEVAGKEIPIQ
jgi:HSP20 family protein